jgi:hypothetical protein
MAPRQSKSQPSTSASSVPVATTVPVDPRNSPACNQSFHNFDYCYQKLLSVKDEIVNGSKPKTLKELCLQLKNLLVMFALQIYVDFADYTK